MNFQSRENALMLKLNDCVYIFNINICFDNGTRLLILHSFSLKGPQTVFEQCLMSN